MKSNSEQKIRIVVAKLGLDSHDRGLRIVAHALRDAGTEVIYLGRHCTVEEIVTTAVQEDADAIGLSNLADSYLDAIPEVMSSLKKKNASHIKVVLGGVIIEEDIPQLKEWGVAEVFTFGARLDAITEWFKNNLGKR